MSGPFDTWRRTRTAAETLRSCAIRGGVKVENVEAVWPADDREVLDEYLKQAIAIRMRDLLRDAADLAETSERTLASSARTDMLNILGEIETPVGDWRP